MRIISIEINNILSIENATVTFSNSGLVLVEGWNHDAGRANGAGKTSIFNSLAFGLYDKMPRKVTASEVLRRGARTGSVIVTVRCGEDEWRVTRNRPKGVVFHKNGLKQEITQEEWESVIRLTYDQFLASMYTAQSTVSDSKRFLLLNDSDKKNFLLQLLNLDKFTECKKFSDTKVKDLETASSKLEAEKASIEARMDAYSESLIDENVYNAAIVKDNSEIAALVTEINSLLEVSKPDFSKYQKLETDIATKYQEFANIKARLSVLHDQHRRLTAKVKPFSGKDSCSFCGSSLDVSGAVHAHQKEMDAINAERQGLKQEIDQCDAALLKEKDVRELSQKLSDKKNKESTEYVAAQDRIRELQSLSKIKTNNVKNLVLKLKENEELNNKIKVLVEQREKVVNNLANNKRDIELYKTISSLYSPTGAQAYVLDSVVESFNEAVQKHIDLVWPNTSYRLNSYKENSKGDVVAKFSETLTMNGSEVSIGSLSGGELKALSLCVDFAILDVLEGQFGIPLNPIILDEPFDGLDSIGREIVLDLLEKLSAARQILVVDHASEAKAMFYQVIRVDKKADISTVTLEA